MIGKYLLELGPMVLKVIGNISISIGTWSNGLKSDWEISKVIGRFQTSVSKIETWIGKYI